MEAAGAFDTSKEPADGFQVIGAGWGRTGTLSVKAALEKLGVGPCYHMSEALFNNKGHPPLWLRKKQGGSVDLAELLCGYKSCVDWPTAAFYKELMDLFPQAKVLLMVRDPDKWYTSAKNTVWRNHEVMENAPWYVRAIMGMLPPGAVAVRMIDEVVWSGDLQGCFGADPDKAKRLFKQHIEEAKQYVPPERLLVYEVSQGWGPLCAFLDKPDPQEPFLHLNDTASWNARLSSRELWQAAVEYGVRVLAALLVVGLAVLLSKHAGFWRGA